MTDVQDDAELPAEPAPPKNPAPPEPPLPPVKPAAEEPAPSEEPAPEPAQFRLRRAPRYLRFGLTGVAIGVVIGLILAFSRSASGDYSEQTIAGYFAASFGLVGALLGLGAAVLADRRRG